MSTLATSSAAASALDVEALSLAARRTGGKSETGSPANGADSLTVKLTGDDQPALLHIEHAGSSDDPTHLHAVRIGGEPCPMRFWMVGKDGGRSSVDISPETVRQIGVQVDLIAQNYKGRGLKFKSINITQALVTFTDPAGKEHVFALDHKETYPAMNAILDIITQDKDLAKRVPVHTFHLYFPNQKGNIRAPKALMTEESATPRLKNMACENLRDFKKKYPQFRRIDDDCRFRAEAVIKARELALEQMIIDTDEELGNPDLPDSAYPALMSRKKQLQDLQDSLGTQYMVMGIVLHMGPIDPNLSIDEQVREAQRREGILKDLVANTRPGNPRSDLHVLHDKTQGREHYHFKDWFGRTDDALLEVELNHIRDTVGMMLGGPGNRLAYVKYIGAENVKQDSDEELAMRYALDKDKTSDDIRAGSLPIVRTGNAALDEEIHGKIADQLDEINEEMGASGTVASKSDPGELEISDEDLGIDDDDDGKSEASSVSGDDSSSRAGDDEDGDSDLSSISSDSSSSSSSLAKPKKARRPPPSAAEIEELRAQKRERKKEFSIVADLDEDGVVDDDDMPIGSLFDPAPPVASGSGEAEDDEDPPVSALVTPPTPPVRIVMGADEPENPEPLPPPPTFGDKLSKVVSWMWPL